MSEMVPLYGFGGSGGGKGAALTVTAPAGSTVTVSKDGKTMTRVSGDDGVVVFRGLESGTWTLSITDGTQTASKTLEIVADYATSITFFAATIHITYPAGSTCTVTDGTTTLTAPDTSGTWACVVPNAGTWTITATSGVATKSDSVDISLDGQTVALTLYFETVLQPGGTWVIGNKGAYGGWLVGSLSNDGTSVTMYNSDYNRCVIARTDEKYDLTGIESITVHIVQNDTGHIAVLGVTDNDTYGWDAGSNNDTATIGGIAQTGNKEIGEITLDVSNITGSHYVAVACHRAGTVIFDSVKLNWKVN